MRANFRAVIFSFLLVSMFACTTQAADRPNVLMIAIDDLNDWVSCLGGHPQAKSPHIDRLAKRGVLFTNAHCQAPICNPSRTSLMLGMRPSSTGIYVNRPWFRTTPNNKGRVTLSQYFAAHGYRTLTTGKIYHGSRVDGPSFQTVGPRPGQRLKIDKQIVTDTGSSSRLWDFGPQQYEEEKFSDFVDASWAIEKLQIKREKPFFLAVGFYRPHVPWYAPQRFFDDRPRSAVQVPVVRDDDRDDLPAGALQLTNNPLPPSHKWFVETDHWKDAVQSYLACVSFTDAQVGRLLDALDKSPYADNTIIVMKLIDKTTEVVLDGLTFTGGNTKALFQADGGGGGLVVVRSRATIRNCVFERNAAGAGGALGAESNPPKRTASILGIRDGHASTTAIGTLVQEMRLARSG